MKEQARVKLAHVLVGIAAPGALLVGLVFAPGTVGAASEAQSAPTVATASTTSSTTTVPTTPPTPPQTPAPTTTTTTTVPFYKVVDRDCAEFEGDDALAEKLEAAKKNNGSTHLVSMARSCGVLFADEAIQDPKLDRPRSNLEYAVYDGDDPFYSKSYDDVTANAEQKLIVIEASTKAWYVLHPELVPTTTSAPATTEKVTATTDKVGATATTRPGKKATTTTEANVADAGGGAGGGDDQDSGGSDTVQILGLLLLGAAAVFWGVYGVINDPDDEQSALEAT